MVEKQLEEFKSNLHKCEKDLVASQNQCRQLE